MNVKPGFPYVITPRLAKKYASHYHISEKSLIVPIKVYGREASCDIRWEDNYGEWQLLQNKFFESENLEPLNAMLEFELYAVWKTHYDSGVTTSESTKTDNTQTIF